MIYYDYVIKCIYEIDMVLDMLVVQVDYLVLLVVVQVNIDVLFEFVDDLQMVIKVYQGDLLWFVCYVVYNYNQESFCFLMDLML